MSTAHVDEEMIKLSADKWLEENVKINVHADGDTLVVQMNPVPLFLQSPKTLPSPSLSNASKPSNAALAKTGKLSVKAMKAALASAKAKAGTKQGACGPAAGESSPASAAVSASSAATAVSASASVSAPTSAFAPAPAAATTAQRPHDRRTCWQEMQCGESSKATFMDAFRCWFQACALKGREQLCTFLVSRLLTDASMVITCGLALKHMWMLGTAAKSDMLRAEMFAPGTQQNYRVLCCVVACRLTVINELTTPLSAEEVNDAVMCTCILRPILCLLFMLDIWDTQEKQVSCLLPKLYPLLWCRWPHLAGLVQLCVYTCMKACPDLAVNAYKMFSYTSLADLPLSECILCCTGRLRLYHLLLESTINSMCGGMLPDEPVLARFRALVNSSHGVAEEISRLITWDTTMLSSVAPAHTARKQLFITATSIVTLLTALAPRALINRTMYEICASSIQSLTNGNTSGNQPEPLAAKIILELVPQTIRPFMLRLILMAVACTTENTFVPILSMPLLAQVPADLVPTMLEQQGALASGAAANDGSGTDRFFVSAFARTTQILLGSDAAAAIFEVFMIDKRKERANWRKHLRRHSGVHTGVAGAAMAGAGTGAAADCGDAEEDGVDMSMDWADAFWPSVDKLSSHAQQLSEGQLFKAASALSLVTWATIRDLRWHTDSIESRERSQARPATSETAVQAERAVRVAAERVFSNIRSSGQCDAETVADMEATLAHLATSDAPPSQEDAKKSTQHIARKLAERMRNSPTDACQTHGQAISGLHGEHLYYDGLIVCPWLMRDMEFTKVNGTCGRDCCAALYQTETTPPGKEGFAYAVCSGKLPSILLMHHNADMHLSTIFILLATLNGLHTRADVRTSKALYFQVVAIQLDLCLVAMALLGSLTQLPKRAATLAARWMSETATALFVGSAADKEYVTAIATLMIAVSARTAPSQTFAHRSAASVACAAVHLLMEEVMTPSKTLEMFANMMCDFEHRRIVPGNLRHLLTQSWCRYDKCVRSVEAGASVVSSSPTFATRTAGGSTDANNALHPGNSTYVPMELGEILETAQFAGCRADGGNVSKAPAGAGTQDVEENEDDDVRSKPAMIAVMSTHMAGAGVMSQGIGQQCQDLEQQCTRLLSGYGLTMAEITKARRSIERFLTHMLMDMSAAELFADEWLVEERSREICVVGNMRLFLVLSEEDTPSGPEIVVNIQHVPLKSSADKKVSVPFSSKDISKPVSGQSLHSATARRSAAHVATKPETTGELPVSLAEAAVSCTPNKCDGTAAQGGPRGTKKSAAQLRRQGKRAATVAGAVSGVPLGGEPIATSTTSSSTSKATGDGGFVQWSTATRSATDHTGSVCATSLAGHTDAHGVRVVNNASGIATTATVSSRNSTAANGTALPAATSASPISSLSTHSKLVSPPVAVDKWILSNASLISLAGMHVSYGTVPEKQRSGFVYVETPQEFNATTPQTPAERERMQITLELEHRAMYQHVRNITGDALIVSNIDGRPVRRSTRGLIVLLHLIRTLVNMHDANDEHKFCPAPMRNTMPYPKLAPHKILHLMQNDVAVLTHLLVEAVKSLAVMSAKSESMSSRALQLLTASNIGEQLQWLMNVCQTPT